MTLHVPSAVEVITCVNVPVLIEARQHDEKLALPRAPNPQRQPEIGALSDRHGIPMFAGDWLELHQPDRQGLRGALPSLIETPVERPF